MLKRTLTALLLIPPVVYLIGWSPKWLFVLAVAVAIVLALREYFALCRAMGFKVFSWIGYGAGVALCVAQMLPGVDLIPSSPRLGIVACSFPPWPCGEAWI